MKSKILGTFSQDNHNLKKTIRLELNQLIKEKPSKSVDRIIDIARELQKNHIKTLNSVFYFVQESIEGFVDRLSSESFMFWENFNRRDLIYSYYDIHCYSAIYQVWDEVYDEFHEELIELDEEKSKRLFDNEGKYYYHFQSIINKEKGNINYALYRLNIFFKSIFTDELIEPYAKSAGLGPTDYESIIYKFPGEGNLERHKALSIIKVIIEELEKFSIVLNNELGIVFSSILGLKNYDFQRIPKIKMGDNICSPVFKSFKIELATLEKLQKENLYNGENQSAIATENPIKVKKLFFLLRDANLIQIDDRNVSILIRLLFDLDSKFYRQYPLGAPDFEITSKEFAHEFKVLLKAMKEDELIAGHSSDIAELVSKIFQCEGLNQVTIQNALKPGSLIEFKHIKLLKSKSTGRIISWSLKN